MDLSDMMNAIATIDEKHRRQDEKKARIISHRNTLLHLGMQGKCCVTRKMARDMYNSLCDLMNKIKF